jgi:hypothetical protein
MPLLYKGYLLNLQVDPPPNGERETTVFMKLIDNVDYLLNSGLGSGTTNKLVRYYDENGHLQDSDIYNSNGKVGINNINPLQALDVNGLIKTTDTIILSGLTADRALYIDSDKKIQSSIVSKTELESLYGINGNVQDQIDEKEDFLGYPTENGQILSSTINGVRSWINKYVHPIQSTINRTLSGALVLSSLVVNTFGHTTDYTTRELLYSDIGAASANHNHSGVYEPVLAAGTSLQYFRGDKTWQALNTSIVPELNNRPNPRNQGSTPGSQGCAPSASPRRW